MGEMTEIQTVVPEKKFAGATEQQLSFQVTLNNTSRPLIQGDRTVNLNLNERFNEERQNITDYRIYGKISPIVDNAYSGLAIDTDPLAATAFNTLLFQNLYYDQPAVSPWPGYPQFNEFDIKRNDVDEFLSTTTNWNMFITYPSECDIEQDMWYQIDNNPLGNNDSVKFKAFEGIPFSVINVTEAGRNIARFMCGSPHNLKKGEFAKINLNDGQGTVFTFQGGNTPNDTFSVYSVGDGTRNSEKTVFNLIIPQGNLPAGGTPSGIPDKTMGTMRRQLNPNNPLSLSKYYVRIHEILTGVDDVVVDECGFEEGIFPNVSQVDPVTPLGVCRISTKNEYPVYLYSFTKDVDVKRLSDNLGRPLTNLYVTTFLRNDKGYFDYPPKYGWKWNFPLTFVDTSVDGNGIAGPNFVRGSALDPQPSGPIVFPVPGGILDRGTPLMVGDKLRGAFCEYNKEELQEYVVSDITHKFNWNPMVFNHGQTQTQGIAQYLEGYMYAPHHEVPIRRFSRYIEFGDPQKVVDVPDWAEYWEPAKEWRWRDLYEIGFVQNGYGVDYPFLNNAQYPSKVIPLYVKRQVRVNSDPSLTGMTSIIDAFIIDGCE